MNLIETIAEQIHSDDMGTDKQSARLKTLYREVSPDAQAGIDAAFICVCGWSLATLITMADEGSK